MKVLGTLQGRSSNMGASNADHGPRRHEAVWPFALAVLSAAVGLFAYAAIADPPGWLNRAVIIIVGALPSNSHAVQLGIGLLLLARGLKLRRLIALYITAAAVVWSTAMSLLTWDQPWRL